MSRATGENKQNLQVRHTSSSGRSSLTTLRRAVHALGIIFYSLHKALFFALLPAVLYSGCTVLPPEEDRTRFIMLASTIPDPSDNAPTIANPKLTSLAIGVGPVKLPQYLDRPELVIHSSPNGFDVSETNSWAEPLAQNFSHILANDLTNLLGTTNMVEYPWYPRTRLEYTVRVEVERFEIDTNQNAELVARWELRAPANDQVVASREAQFSHPSMSAAGDAAAGALSDNVAELARQIASAITQAEQQRLARGPR
jgi:uncharacterized lipoprotein YmbA